MPAELKISGIEYCIKSQQKECLYELKGLIKSLAKLRINPDCEVFKVLVKRFLYTVTSIPDNYFLSDVCESSYELFLEFRILLGYFEKGQTDTNRFRIAFEEILEISSDIYEMFKGFLSDPGYSGTNFPKPKKLKSMRELGLIVKDVNEVLLLSKLKLTPSLTASANDHVALDMTNGFNYHSKPKPKPKPKENINNLVPNDYIEEMIQKDENFHIVDIDIESNRMKSSPNDSIKSFSTESSVCSESNLLKSYETPQAPILFHEDLKMSSSVTMRRSSGSLVDSLLISGSNNEKHSMIRCTAPPVPPTSNHGRISYVKTLNESKNENVPIRRCKSVATLPNRTGNLRPPMLVDDDGDILPTGPIPQLRSAVPSTNESINERRIFTDDEEAVEDQEVELESIHKISSAKVIEDNNSFIMAYRNRNRSVESDEIDVLEPSNINYSKFINTENDGEVNTKVIKTMNDFELSGWNNKNRF